MSNFKPNESTYMKIVDLCIFGQVLSIFIMAIPSFLCFIIYPDSPGLPGNVLPTDCWFIFPLIYIFPMYTTVYFFIIFGMVINSAFILGTTYIPLLVRELPVGKRNHKYYSNEILRSPENIIHVYMTVEILQNKINQLCGILLIPFQTVTTLLFTFSGYVVIRHRDTIGIGPVLLMLTWAICAPAVWGMILIMGGYLHSNGVKILSSWKRYSWKTRAERKLMSKFVKSCKPLIICYQNVFVIRKISVMIYVRILSRSLARTLLTLDKY